MFNSQYIEDDEGIDNDYNRDFNNKEEPTDIYFYNAYSASFLSNNQFHNHVH